MLKPALLSAPEGGFANPDWSAIGLVLAIVGSFLLANSILFRHPRQLVSERLGIKESVVARLAELGGSARLFSSPGAGTTVLLEVPR